MRRKKFLIAGTVLMAASFAACGGNGESKATPTPPAATVTDTPKVTEPGKNNDKEQETEDRKMTSQELEGDVCRADTGRDLKGNRLRHAGDDAASGRGPVCDCV